MVKGNTLYLCDADGNDERSCTLAGSGASIQALVGCVGAIASGSLETNPFK